MIRFSGEIYSYRVDRQMNTTIRNNIYNNTRGTYVHNMSLFLYCWQIAFCSVRNDIFYKSIGGIGHIYYIL